MKKSPTVNALRIEKTIKAPVERVFRAWTEAGQMVQWWSPEGIECRDAQADPKVGGAYRIHMVSKDGKHTAYGKYTQIIPNKRLQFTWQWEEKDMPQTIVTVEFEGVGEITRLTLLHKGFVSKEEVESHSWGWTTCLEKRFAPYVEKHGS
ncbi:MAG: SRPBCC domain-containing protein [Candidatus Omnitrophota bacterium]|nr:SRPBCC domain-containing protein [Candidatus Omnitrophota bacterium]MDZ4241975.1 SRPBCC domain-containing protein [Candidatus Omnitrophota bacterium]